MSDSELSEILNSIRETWKTASAEQVGRLGANVRRFERRIVDSAITEAYGANSQFLQGSTVIDACIRLGGNVETRRKLAMETLFVKLDEFKKTKSETEASWRETCDIIAGMSDEELEAAKSEVLAKIPEGIVRQSLVGKSPRQSAALKTLIAELVATKAKEKAAAEAAEVAGATA